MYLITLPENAHEQHLTWKVYGIHSILTDMLAMTIDLTPSGIRILKMGTVNH
jgi:hypothetical protein